ncbi:hypothetical protein CRUP_022377 [Coryphaenoides rupestris]|nr:hypothetical protein CRUP_022377 [Coryphaenoides rupestris]
MWHENYDEMLKILTSMFRLDRYRGDPNEDHKDCFDFESHIYVDDSFYTDKETGKRLVNEYVDILVYVVIEVYRVFTHKEPDDVSIIETPYGGRLLFVMPEGNMLYVHLKDKTLIRNKKRWESMVSLDRDEAFYVPLQDRKTHTKHISDNNIYIMALDGDTDFQPKALVLLLDRLRMYGNVGAACGRIHPTGMGEDRWLCTLLLQQGWRVEYNAASDAYTNSPEEFKEFYNQRRRWGPSTLANTLDLLHSGPETVKRNTSISRLYIFYQMFTVGSSILGPASVTLMISGAFQFVFSISGTISIIIGVIPPTFYLIICFITKANTQITIAAIMSIIYAFLMTASFFSIIGMIIYGLMYFICIPSGYLLLTIYSLVNLNNVSWGTRETKE